jgi:hypothetical protein
MILYVTSFNKHLYNSTGKNLLKTFVSHKTEGDLLITYEDDIDIPKHEALHFYNLDDDDYLNNWLESNKSIIPVRLGGAFEGEFENKFHERAAEWFRKIASLHHAVTLGYDKIIFLDCDVVVNKHLPESKINEVFGESSMFYHFGPHRQMHRSGIESGIIGFDMTKDGGKLLNHVFQKYDDGSFEKYTRWDDAWMFTVAVMENPHINTKDIVSRHSRSGHVVADGELSEHLQHFKGIHWKKYGVKYL